MLRTAFRFVAVTALAALFVLPAAAQDSTDIEQMLRERDREIKAILGTSSSYTDQQREQLRTLINGVIDFRAMSAYALGDTWGTLTPDQQAHFVEVFSGIVRSQSLADLDLYRATVAYGTIDVDGTAATATTTTTYRDTQAEVVYDLARSGGAWYVTDITIDDVSTAENYRRSFQRVIARRGYDALLASLEKRLARG